MKSKVMLSAAAMMLSGVAAMAQTPSNPNAAGATFPNKPAQMDTAAMMAEHGKALLAKAAKSPEGSATEVLNRYNGYYTMLVARVRSGQVEQHADWDDFFFVLDGELTEVVGGKTDAMHPTTAGEMRGDKMTGGESNRLLPGSVLHIAVNVPHLTTVPAGKTVVYYVIKEAVKK